MSGKLISNPKDFATCFLLTGLCAVRCTDFSQGFQPYGKVKHEKCSLKRRNMIMVLMLTMSAAAHRQRHANRPCQQSAVSNGSLNHQAVLSCIGNNARKSTSTITCEQSTNYGTVLTTRARLTRSMLLLTYFALVLVESQDSNEYEYAYHTSTIMCNTSSGAARSRGSSQGVRFVPYP
eukprot:scaffold675297_cov62-Prasinocladus_malaysianus.AAC.1